MPLMNRLPMLLLLFATACGAGKDSAPLEGGDTCTALVSGTWTVTGAAWGMGDTPMDGDVEMDASACTFTFSNWSMQMDDLPTGGALDGTAMQLDGLNSYWRSCTGTVADESNASGTCTDNDAEWVMAESGGI